MWIQIEDKISWSVRKSTFLKFVYKKHLFLEKNLVARLLIFSPQLMLLISVNVQAKNQLHTGSCCTDLCKLSSFFLSFLNLQVTQLYGGATPFNQFLGPVKTIIMVSSSSVFYAAYVLSYWWMCFLICLCLTVTCVLHRAINNEKSPSIKITYNIMQSNII